MANIIRRYGAGVNTIETDIMEQKVVFDCNQFDTDNIRNKIKGFVEWWRNDCRGWPKIDK